MVKTNERNVFCPFYKKCLDHAVLENKPDFDCSECQYYHLKVDVRETEFNLFGYWALLAAIFKPELFKMYQEDRQK